MISNPPKNRQAQFSGIQTWEDSFRHMVSLSQPLDNEGKEIEGQLEVKVEPGSNYVAYNHPFKRRGVSVQWENDVLVRRAATDAIVLDHMGRLALEAKIIAAVKHLMSVGQKCSTNPQSKDYLPGKLAAAPQWQHLAWFDLVAAFERLLGDGRLIKVAVKDAWLIRTPDGDPYLGERE